MYYDWRGRKQRPSFSAVVTCGVIIVCALVYALTVVIGQAVWGTAGGDPSEREVRVLNWLDFLYFLSYVKASRATVGGQRDVCAPLFVG